ncbi:MAG: hypothetical protein K1000chlam3_00584 [Chlamydiae bacterium]|nr:hypothetical protein [Chlamydiota bacterium]
MVHLQIHSTKDRSDLFPYENSLRLAQALKSLFLSSMAFGLFHLNSASNVHWIFELAQNKEGIEPERSPRKKPLFLLAKAIYKHTLKVDDFEHCAQ